jgi:hypothetical protein
MRAIKKARQIRLWGSSRPASEVLHRPRDEAPRRGWAQRAADDGDHDGLAQRRRARGTARGVRPMTEPAPHLKRRTFLWIFLAVQAVLHHVNHHRHQHRARRRSLDGRRLHARRGLRRVPTRRTNLTQRRKTFITARLIVTIVGAATTFLLAMAIIRGPIYRRWTVCHNHVAGGRA